MNRKIFAIVIIVSIAAHGFLFWKDRRPTPKGFNYKDNPQFKEQTKIFPAYNSYCDIAFIGDSHIYKCHWSELLGVVTCNRGIGSDITEGVYSRIHDILAVRPKTCFISAGANDIDLNTHPDTTVRYINLIVRKLKEAGIRPVVMEITSVAPGYSNPKFNERAEDLNKRFRAIAETICITVGDGDIQEDGIHLTGTGYEKWKKAIFAKLK